MAAEAIELNFPTEDNNSKVEKDLRDTILSINLSDNNNITDSEESCPPQFTSEEYYKEDDLGKSVLEMKYLAPGEKSPWDLWKRQAKALASVEKLRP